MTIFSHRVYNSLSTIGQKCDILPSVPKEWNETFAAALRSENILEKKERKNEHEEVPCNHDGAVHDAVRVCRGGNRESRCQHGRQPLSLIHI